VIVTRLAAAVAAALGEALLGLGLALALQAPNTSEATASRMTGPLRDVRFIDRSPPHL
jgi:hypothetical protein